MLFLNQMHFFLGERYKAYHQEAERIVTDLGPTTWEAITQSTLNKGNHSPATLYISGKYRA